MLRSLESAKHRIRLGTEMLESRQLLAGAVDAFLMGGNNLFVIGDQESNQISVARFGDEVVITSMDGDTRINGQLEVTFPSVVAGGNAFFDLGQGDNVLRLGGEAHGESETEQGSSGDTEEPHDESEERLTFTGDVEIVTGRGADSIRVTFVNVLGSLTIGTTSGDDSIDVGRGPGFGDHGHETEFAVAVNVETTTAAEDDHGGTAGPPADVFVGGQLLIKAGSGEDGVKVAFTDVVDNLVIDSGPNDDYVLTGRGPVHGEHGPGEGGGGHGELLVALEEEPHDSGGRPPDVHVLGDMFVSTGAGDDFALLRNAFVAAELRLFGQAGNDALGTQNLDVAGDASLDGSSGCDVIATIASRFQGSLTVDGRSGNDLVFIGTTMVEGAADVSLSSSDDAVAISRSQFNSAVTLNGGSGSDSSLWSDEGNEFNMPVDETAIENELSLDMDEVIGAIEEIFAGFLQGSL